MAPKKRKRTLPPSTQEEVRFGIRLLNEKDLDRAAGVIVKTCPSFEIILGPTCLVAKKDVRALENALRKENIPSERVRITFTIGHTRVTHSVAQL